MTQHVLPNHSIFLRNYILTFLPAPYEIRVSGRNQYEKCTPAKNAANRVNMAAVFLLCAVKAGKEPDENMAHTS